MARAKSIINRLATLEVRLLDESVIGKVDASTPVPFGSEMFISNRGEYLILTKEPVITGDDITNATASFD
ncbi:hypothetical protein ABTE05_21070, partial [Acinetobacter baumannii]